jgi:hypothetical protein
MSPTLSICKILIFNDLTMEYLTLTQLLKLLIRVIGLEPSIEDSRKSIIKKFEKNKLTFTQKIANAENELKKLKASPQ